MLRALLPAFLCALAAVPVASQEAPQPGGGFHSKTPGKHHQPAVDEAQLAVLWAKFNQAKASGKLCPEREAHMVARLMDLEALVQASKPKVHVPGSGRTEKPH